MKDTGRTTMPYPTDARVDPRVAKWELIADWSAVQGGMRPVEITLSVEREDNFRPYVRWPIVGHNGDGSPIYQALPTQIGPVWPGLFAGAFCGGMDSTRPDSSTLWESPNAGAFRLSYGRNAVGRTMCVDLTSARLYLGNCDVVRIEALRWHQTELDERNESLRDKDPYKVSAQIGIAQGGTYDDAICTMLAMPEDVVPGAARFARFLYAPSYASAFEPVVAECIEDAEASADAPDEQSTFETDDPDFRFVQEQGQSLLVRPRTGEVWPRRRVPLSSGRLRVFSTQPLARSLYIGARFVLST